MRVNVLSGFDGRRLRDPSSGRSERWPHRRRSFRSATLCPAGTAIPNRYGGCPLSQIVWPGRQRHARYRDVVVRMKMDGRVLRSRQLRDLEETHCVPRFSHESPVPVAGLSGAALFRWSARRDGRASCRSPTGWTHSPFARGAGISSARRTTDEAIRLNSLQEFADVDVRVALRTDLLAVVGDPPLIAPQFSAPFRWRPSRAPFVRALVRSCKMVQARDVLPRAAPASDSACADCCPSGKSTSTSAGCFSASRHRPHCRRRHRLRLGRIAVAFGCSRMCSAAQHTNRMQQRRPEHRGHYT